MNITFKKVKEGAIAPEYKTSDAAGADLCVAETTVVEPGKATILPLGIAVEIPENHFGMLSLRSSTPIKKGLFIPNGVGIIDADYRGELGLIVAPLGQEPITIEKGERIAQLVILPCRYQFNQSGAEFIQNYTEVAELSDTVRGAGGFGSTGS